MSAQGKRNIPLLTKANGRLVKEKICCDKCNEYGKIKNGLHGSVYAVYTFGKGFLCRACAKKHNVI